MITKKYEIRGGAIRDAWEIDEMPLIFESEDENEIYCKLLELDSDDYIVREYVEMQYADGSSWQEKDLNDERVHTYGARSFKETHSTWYAIEMDEDDNDWGYGSYDETEAKAMLMDVKSLPFHEAAHIAVIHMGRDPECVEVVMGDDFTTKDIRKYTGLSQQKFADYYGIPKRSIENWETNKSEPPGYLVRLLWRAASEDFKWHK